MKALVLGGNGFIGSHVVDELLFKGHIVRVFDREMEKYRSPLPGVDYRTASFDDITALTEALEGVDIVFHLISTTVPSTSNSDPVYDVQSNLVGTIHLLNLMRDTNVSRIVYLSSGGTVYGIPECSPIPVSLPLRPICSYGIVKVAIENYLHMYQYLYGLEPVILRASNPYGERQGPAGGQGVISAFIGKILSGEPIEVWGDGSVVRDFIYVTDLAKLCVQAGHSSHSGIFNAGSGNGYSINEILKVIGEISNLPIKPQYLPGRAFDVPTVVLDIASAKETFDWSPRISLPDGLGFTWEWLKGVIENQTVT